MIKIKFLQIIYYIVLVFVIFVAGVLIVSSLPITGNIKLLTVISGSMEPTIKLGSVVLIKPEQDYKIGHIITFGKDTKTEKPTTHRVYDIKVEGGQVVYITRGDANNAPDSKEITNKDILGKVLLVVPYAGYVVDFARKPLGFVVFIIVPAVLIVGDELRKIYAEVKKKKETPV